MQCVILAGGLATRMRPLTETCPKALLEVAGRPFLDHQLAWLAKHGVTEVVLLVAHLGEQIEGFAGDGRRWGLKLTYSYEAELLGTGGSLGLALGRGMLQPKFLLTYGDSYLRVDFAAVFRHFSACGQPALMTVYRNENKFDGSNARFRNGIVERYTKCPTLEEKSALAYIDYGLLAFDRSVLDNHQEPGARWDLSELLESLSSRGNLAGLEMKERFYEIGSPSGLAELETLLREHP